MLRYLQRLLQNCVSDAEVVITRRSPEIAVQTFNMQLEEAQTYWARAVAVEQKLSVEQANVVSSC